MSMAFKAFGMILLVSRSFAVLLSIWIGVRGWGWPISSRVWRIETAVFAFINKAPSSASAADDMTARMICEMFRTAPLFVGMSSFDDMNICPPAWLRALGSDKYNASLWMASTMLLAL